MAVKPIPDGYHSITPYLIIDGAADSMEFYGKAFGAEVMLQLPGPEGKVMHAEIKIGDSIVMVADEFPEMDIRGPKSLGGSPVGLMIYLEDVDARFQQALDAGGTVKKPLQDQFYGDRSGTLEDPFGHQWTLSTHVEDVSGEEIGRRFQEFMSKQGGDCQTDGE